MRWSNTFFFLITTTVISPVSHAKTLNEIQAGENEVAYRSSKLEQINIVHGRFRLAREQYINGDLGMIHQTDLFDQAASKWMNVWRQIIQIKVLVDDPKLADPLMLAEAIKDKMRAQRTAYEEIKSLGLKSLVQHKEAKKHLDGIRDVVANNYPERYRPHAEALLKQIDQTKKQTDLAATQISERMQQLENVYEPTRRALITALDKALIASGRSAIDEAMRQAQAVVTADAMVEPLIVEARQRYNEFRILRARNLIFSAEEQKNRISDIAQTAASDIGRSGLPTRYTDEAMNYINGYAKRAQSEFEMLKSDGPAKSMQAAGHKLQKIFLQRCRNHDVSVKCHILKVLAGISDEQISTMSLDELKAYERSWLSVGPLTMGSTP